MKKHIKQLAAGSAALALILAVAGTTSAAPVYAVVTGHAAHSPANNKAATWGADCFKVEAGQGGVSGETYVLQHDYTKVIVKAGGNNAGNNANTIFGDSPSAGETVWADFNGNGVYDGPDKTISHIIFCGESDTSSTTSFESSEASTTESTTQSNSESSSESTSESSSESTSESTSESSSESTSESTSESSSESTSESSSESTTSFESSELSTTDSQSSTTSFSDSVSDTTTQPPTDTIGSTGSGQQSSGLWMLLAVLGVLAGSVIVLAPSKADSKD